MKIDIQRVIFLTILAVQLVAMFSQPAHAQQITNSQVDVEASNLVTVFQGLKDVHDNYVQIRMTPQDFLTELAQKTNDTVPQTVTLLQNSINECLTRMQGLEYARAQGGAVGQYADSVIQKLASQYRITCPRSINELLSRPN